MRFDILTILNGKKSLSKKYELWIYKLATQPPELVKMRKFTTKKALLQYISKNF